MTALRSLECTKCGAQHPADRLINLCPCGGILYPRYDLAALKGSYDRTELANGPKTLWRYRRVLPVRDDGNVISLGEGFTPIFQASRRGPFRAFPSLYIKDEGLFRSAAGGLVRGQLGQILVAVADGLRIAAKQLGHILDSAVAKLFGFNSRVASPIFFRQRIIKPLHVPLRGGWVSHHGRATVKLREQAPTHGITDSEKRELFFGDS